MRRDPKTFERDEKRKKQEMDDRRRRKAMDFSRIVLAHREEFLKFHKNKKQG
jgi:hypothetical protein